MMEEVPSSTPVLNEWQKGRLRATLLLIEKGIDEIETILETPPTQGLFRQQIDDLSGETRETIRVTVGQIRKSLAELKRRFLLPAETEMKSRLIFGKTPILWEIALGATSKSLAAYGRVSAELPALLDPTLEEISGLLMTMERLVAPDPRGSSAVSTRLDKKRGSTL